MGYILNFSNVQDARSSVSRLMVALISLELLFPPKSWNNGFISQSLGWVFIFRDPMGEVNHMMKGLGSTSINWVLLAVQLVITIAVASGIRSYLANK
jgi:hypothetical protein